MNFRSVRRSIKHSAGTLVTVLAGNTRKRLFLMLLAIALLTSLLLSVADNRLQREEMLSMKLGEMRNELDYLISTYRVRQEEIIMLQMQLQNNLDTKQPEELPALQPEIVNLLKNINDSRLAAGLNTKRIHGAPYVYQLLPHYMDSPTSLYPGFHLKGTRNHTEYIFGIPTVRRDKENYLLITLEHLLIGLKDKYEESTLIVVCVGETDLQYVLQVAHQIITRFPKQVESGMIEVISPSEGFYPDISKKTPNLGDSRRRFNWRTKQNLDAIFLMAYAQTKGTYYLMLEDDVIAVPTYMDTIKKYTLEVSSKNPNWIYIEYCQIGGIGKLFKSSSLKHFVMYLELFYASMPIDWLLEKYLESLECPLHTINSKDCANLKLRVRPRYESSLFQHVGLYSSLKGKIQKIKDSKASSGPKFHPHTNPPLESMNTTIKAHGEWSLMDAYLGLNFFWGITPKKGDFIEFVFKEPTYMKSYLFRSGNVDHILDRFQNTIIEVTPTSVGHNATVVGSFDELGLAESTINRELGPIQAMRLKVLKDQTTWVILSEISLVPYDSKSQPFEQPKLLTGSRKKSPEHSKFAVSFVRSARNGTS